MPKETKGKPAVRSADTTSTSSPSRPASKPYHKRSGSTTSTSNSQHPKKKQHLEKPQSSSSSNSSGLPGASKIKASIRQTKRLLSKPNLAPGTKIEAERRLKSLQADLDAASRKHVEKARASRYHRVKFVERQKLVRRIARCKRNLARVDSGKLQSESDSDSEGGSQDEDEGVDDEQRANESRMGRDELVEMLTWLRELLQYVVQYPADLRYVALFPNARDGPAPPDASEKDKSRQKAFQHLERVRNAMQAGELSNQPEVELSNHDRPRTKLAQSHSHASTTSTTNNAAATAEKGAKHKNAKSKRNQPVPTNGQEDDEQGIRGVRDDDFFAQDSEGDE